MFQTHIHKRAISLFLRDSLACWKNHILRDFSRVKDNFTWGREWCSIGQVPWLKRADLLSPIRWNHLADGTHNMPLLPDLMGGIESIGERWPFKQVDCSVTFLSNYNLNIHIFARSAYLIAYSYLFMCHNFKLGNICAYWEFCCSQFFVNHSLSQEYQ